MRSTNVRSFIDTNVLAYTDDHDSPRKQEAALGVVEETRRSGTGVVSTQVLQEYFAVATRKLGVIARVARRKVELFSRFNLVVIDLPDILAATDLHIVHGVSFWDALVVAAAKRSGCRVLFSENLLTGRDLDGLRIVNPFA